MGRLLKLRGFIDWGSIAAANDGVKLNDEARFCAALGAVLE